MIFGNGSYWISNKLMVEFLTDLKISNPLATLDFTYPGKACTVMVEQGMGTSASIRISGFPYHVSAKDVTGFLENLSGKGTVFALKVKQSKSHEKNRKAFVTVQFTESRVAELMLSTINQPLKAWMLERDVIPGPRTLMLTLEATALHLGCQTSDNNFTVFEEMGNVKAHFGFGIRRIELLLTYCDVEYKLEVSYASISQIDERSPWNQDSIFIVIQLIAAPKIYEKHSYRNSHLFYNYYKHTQDDEWKRRTDFTASACIGQSSALCLEFQQTSVMPWVRKCFHQYRVNSSVFLVEYGSTFSSSLRYGPIVSPPKELKLPFDLLYKVNSLVQNGCLVGPNLGPLFFNFLDPQKFPITFIEYALEKLFNLRECCYDPVKWLSEQYTLFNTSKLSHEPTSVTLGKGLVYIRRVLVTPTRVYYCGPEANISNRVLRNFHEAIDHFIRVSFVDEDGEKMWSLTETKHGGKMHTALYERVLSTLSDGITIGNKKFQFLAFSSSQVRENSTWMFAEKDKITAGRIRDWMGDFRGIKNVAKFAARLGQSFGSSIETLTVHGHEIEVIPDIEIETNGTRYVFSDGIGKISMECARRVAEECGIVGSTPSAFQIRFAGYKGVVAVDPKSVAQLSLRNSMYKYSSGHTKLDVLAWSKYQPCFLNRQIITLLSTLGVKDRIFQNKQRETIKQVNETLTDPVKAYQTLDAMAPQESITILKIMLLCGYRPDVEPFLQMMLQAFRGQKLLELRNKARIFVPRGRSMMGCLDETGTLKYGEVFVQVSRLDPQSTHPHVPFAICSNESEQCGFICEGKVVVAKNPCLYPGDIRVLQAVNIPALHHMVDCIVFPQKGYRPHPDECSGSDLDGDIYFVSWDPELIPPRVVPPMDYSPAQNSLLDHDVRIEEVQKFFANYIVSDNLGIIANAHTVFADKESKKADSEACIELAKLFSIAVDFPKTGVPAVIPPHLHVKEYPDFMGNLDKPSYESDRVLGKMFREVRDIAPEISIKPYTREVAMQAYDHEMEVDGFDKFLDGAQYWKAEYDFKLVKLMDYYGIETEAEIFCGSVLKLKKSLHSSKDVESLEAAVKSLKNEARNWFYDKRSARVQELLAKASAWYHVTYHPKYWDYYGGMNRTQFLSFPWCISDVLIHIKKGRPQHGRGI